ncbi:cytidylyltransferase domain-containing protein [Vibrio coralliilyticus]|uniref:acylneuraminate cytidylyltransferase family protein n=1 Tax=Vibrio coralliilyticus TaxID=190893 RepID=UPI0015609AA5|nr:acylneuraminate cytidylyltransferase family protein [Vibrio coralliilyticus]NRF33152.1 acylneuraminate cytidylyltransferase family protein [Vibrio coralliilyticus]NRF55671.1 acylneuraminate cytidylyltransferase family protein [Vibrio coralliilyticus]
MIEDKKILAVVPARGGSKGVKLKNIRTVNGKPLVALVGEVISQIGFIDYAMVSTDHVKIAEVAKASGLQVPFYRPAYLSGDRIGDVEVLTHSLIEAEKLNDERYDLVVMLQPTSPTRTAKHVSDAIELLISENADSVWTVSETDSKGNPLKQLTINDGCIDFYDDRGAKIIARQELIPTYHKNGVAYVMTRDCLLEHQSIKGKKCVSLVIEEPMANIDTEMDIAFAEFLGSYVGKEH